MTESRTISSERKKLIEEEYSRIAEVIVNEYLKIKTQEQKEEEKKKYEKKNILLEILIKQLFIVVFQQKNKLKSEKV